VLSKVAHIVKRQTGAKEEEHLPPHSTRKGAHPALKKRSQRGNAAKDKTGSDDGKDGERLGGG